MQFFRYFSTIPYTFQQADGSKSVIEITNISEHVKIMEALRQNISVLYDYIVSDGERPDTVAAKVYGSADYTWIVLVMNGIFSLYDWPLNQHEFNDYIVDRYGSQANAESQLLYRTADGFRVDAVSYALLPVTEQGGTTTAYDEELRANEVKRRIKVVPIDYVFPLVQELKLILSQ